MTCIAQGDSMTQRQALRGGDRLPPPPPPPSPCSPPGSSRPSRRWEGRSRRSAAASDRAGKVSSSRAHTLWPGHPGPLTLLMIRCSMSWFSTTAAVSPMGRAT